MRQALEIEELKKVYGRIAKRYDIQHGFITVKTDQRGRELLVNKSITEGNEILDCGCGTGTTGIIAAKKIGTKGQITFFDLSDDMMNIAKEKVVQEGLHSNVVFQTGDMVHLPFEDNKFDVVFSTYSLCPLYDPEKGALELYRVTKPGGKIAVAHSTEPKNKIVKLLANRIENFTWHFPWLSMGCRSVNVLPALKREGCKIIFLKNIGVPLWPFLVFIVQKPTT